MIINMISGTRLPLGANDATPNSIQWTGSQRWNFTTGCTKVKRCADCMNCYAEEVSTRLQKKGLHKYRNGFDLTIHHHLLEAPYRWEYPSLCFVNSMSDMFHPDVPDEVIHKAFEVMNDCPNHHFQILTKRTERVLEMAHQLNWTPNIWMGTSVGTNGRIFQIELLRQIPAAIRFVSFEPLLAKLVPIDLTGIHWAILGGESPGAHGMRSSKIEYFTSLIEQCDQYDVRVFVKQLGGVLGRDYRMRGKDYYKGGDFSKFPEDLKRREFPIDVSKLY